MINSQHYTKEQIAVWAPVKSLEPEGWLKKFLTTNPFVAQIEDQVVGFAELQNGHIDCFYCHHLWIGQGVGSALMDKIFEEACQKNITHVYADRVSITAKPFFEKRFTVISEQIFVRNNVNFLCYKMEKKLRFEAVIRVHAFKPL